MTRSVVYQSLRDLLVQFESVSPKEVTSPEIDRPDNAELLGYASFHLQQIWTVYARMSLAYATSPEALEEERLSDKLSRLSKGKRLSKTTRKLIEERYMLLATLSGKSTVLNFVWSYFIAETAILFPHPIYLIEPVSVMVYSDWSIAIDQDGMEDNVEKEKGLTASEMFRPRLLN